MRYEGNYKGTQLAAKIDTDNINIQKILNFLPYPFLVSEVKSGIRHNIFVNDAFKYEIGFSLEEIPTLQAWFIKAYHDVSYRSQIIAEWTKRESIAHRLGADAVVMQARISTKTKGAKWYEVKASIHGEIQFVAFVNIDAEIQKEEEMQRLIEDNARTLSILSHDLRSPLGNLSTAIKMALEGSLTEDERSLILRKLNNQVFQLQEFLDATLQWSRSSFEKVVIVYQSTDITKIINTILALYKDVIFDKQIKIRLSFKNGLSVVTDENIITIIIRNLISNAIKFTVIGGEISLKAYQKKYSFIIKIQNSGVGIKKHKIDAILKRTSISDKGTAGEKGLGLGLKLCLTLLDKINGKLSIESTENSSTFKIKLLTTPEKEGI